MPAELRWNRLVIAAQSEEEFLQAVADYFPQLLQLPYEDVEVDITGTEEITEDAFRSIAIKLIGGEAAEKKMLIRIPPSVDRYFRHANLYRMVDIQVVQPVSGNGKGDPAAVKAAIKGGDSGRAAPSVDVTERAPSEEEKKPAKQPVAKRATGKASKAEVAFLIDIETGVRQEINDKVVIGREPPSDLVYQIPTISKRHFIIRRHEGTFVIEDLRSTNGTYLNGLPVHEPVPLREGDEIVVAITLKHPKGARIFQFTTRGPDLG